MVLEYNEFTQKVSASNGGLVLVGVTEAFTSVTVGVGVGTLAVTVMVAVALAVNVDVGETVSVADKIGG